MFILGMFFKDLGVNLRKGVFYFETKNHLEH
jgi:hypothetical protein